jgi:hypothetical protein
MEFVLDEAELLIVSFVYVDIAIMKKALQAFFCDPARHGKYAVSEGVLDLEHVKIGAPNLGGKIPLSAIVYMPRAHEENCVFISNNSDGWTTLVHRMCKDMSADCLRVSTSRDDADYPFNLLHFYRQGQEVRLVRVMKDGDRWEFFEKGDPLPFEKISNYKKRKIRDRLNRESLLTAVESAGINLRDPNFWQTNFDAIRIDELRCAA